MQSPRPKCSERLNSAGLTRKEIDLDSWEPLFYSLDLGVLVFNE
jgi:hypothetical protein